jgi:His-Xaa-Ser system radical SAM maturase HxsC
VIPLVRPAVAEGDAAYVTRLLSAVTDMGPQDSVLFEEDAHGASYSGSSGLISIDGLTGRELDGDVVLVQPRAGRIERLFRAGSVHNTLLVTERCDQLCVMCSQPPKKTHVDRFDLLEAACLLVEPGSLIGVSGGEPTLYKNRLLAMLERVLREREDVQFHVLTNGQHFAEDDVQRLRDPVFGRVSWGIPLYAADAALHDEIVGKDGAFARLEESFARLIMAGGRVELRTVVLESNIDALPELARDVAARLQFVEAWSIMQLEHIGFAKGRWRELFVDHRDRFAPIAAALDHSSLHGVRAQLFNFPRCTVPPLYRGFAIASISDWKRKFAGACSGCREREACSGFFEWHPDEEAEMAVRPL